MAATSGRGGPPLSDLLRREAHRFDFFQAVRLLEREGVERPDATGDAARHPVGADGSPRQEVVRFRAFPALSFPAGSITELRPPSGDSPEAAAGPLEMVVAFMGLTGPQGVLPRHYTSLLIERIRGRDYALRDFLDLFNHRLISLFYRAWEKYRFPIGYERARLSEAAGGRDAEDLFTRCLYCLLGLGTGKLRRRMEFDDETFLYYAGFFAHRPRSAAALESMLADYFELPLHIEQFVGQWLYLDVEDQSALPSPGRPRGLNMQLGTNVVAGQRVWGIESKFRIRLGPLGYRDFCRFLPSGDALGPICQMIRSYVGVEFDFDVQPVLKAEEVPACRLGGDGGDPARLGWNTWIRSGMLRNDVSDAVFSLEGSPWTTRV